MKRSSLLCLLALAGCGEAVQDNHFAADDNAQAPVAEPAAIVPPAVPVRIGELGASFDACGTAATTRNTRAGAGLPVRAAPFDTAAESASIPAGARFFVCSRSHDQRWLGVVWNDAGELSAECGVSSPVTSRRDYPGPCRSGWVQAAFVKLIAG
jgi:hypothetical protein